MNNQISKNILVFVAVVCLMALMDVFNFIVPHNSGFFSLTYGGEIPVRFDAWHLLKILILGLILYGSNNFKDRDYFFYYIIGAVLAFVLQLVIYNWIFKSLII